MDEIESDFSVYHRVDDFERRASDWIIKFAGKLVAYRGALWLAMERDEGQHEAAPTAPVFGPSTGFPQAVDNSAAGDDTPPEVIAQLQRQALVATMQATGVKVTGVLEIGDSEMERLVNSG